jgi:NADPH-dependent curcumin reductase CurA
MVQYSRIVLAERPKAGIEEKHFRKEIATLADVSSLKPNEVLVQVQHLSLDPGVYPDTTHHATSRLTCGRW